MQRRRKLMGMQSAVQALDTSPRIAAYDKAFPSGKGSLVDRTDSCVTEIYDYPEQSYIQTIAMYGRDDNFSSTFLRVYRDGDYKDYWGEPRSSEITRNCINKSTNGIAFTLQTSKLNDCYAYFVETGQIFFAGKNSIYYGHRNISELN